MHEWELVFKKSSPVIIQELFKINKKTVIKLLLSFTDLHILGKLKAVLIHT